MREKTDESPAPLSVRAFIWFLAAPGAAYFVAHEWWGFTGIAGGWVSWPAAGVWFAVGSVMTVITERGYRSRAAEKDATTELTVLGEHERLLAESRAADEQRRRELLTRLAADMRQATDQPLAGAARRRETP